MIKYSLLILCFCLIAFNFAVAEPPNWSVENSGQYGLQENVTALLFFNDVQVEGTENMVAAFVGETVRGVANPVQIGSDWVFFLTIYANTEGEYVTFKAYVAAEDAILDVEETIFFSAGQLNDFNDPFIWNAYSGLDRAPVVSGIPDQAIEEDSGSFTVFDLDDYLTELDGDVVSWSYSGNTNLSVTIDGENQVTIESINPQWIGTENISFTATDDTPNQYADSDIAGFTILPEDHPPQVGSIPSQIIINGQAFTSFDLDDYLTELDGDAILWDYEFLVTPQGNAPPSWTPVSYGSSMSIVARVVSYGNVATGANHILAAFVGEEVRGVAQAIDGGGLGWLYFLTVNGDTDGEEISFKFFDANGEDILPVDETTLFVGGSVWGDASAPVTLNSGNLSVDINEDNITTISILDEGWLGTQSIKFIAKDIGSLHEYSDFSWVDFTVEDANMQLHSCTIFYPDTTQLIRNKQDQIIMAIKVMTTGGISPLSISQFDLDTAPSDNPTTDILGVNLYFTGNNAQFSSENLIGSTTPPDGAFAVFLNQQLSAGENYFWLTYDVPAIATTGNILNCQCTSFTFSGQTDIPIIIPPDHYRRISSLQKTEIVGEVLHTQNQIFSVGADEICEVIWDRGSGILPNNLMINVSPETQYPNVMNGINRYWSFKEDGGVFGWSARVRFYYKEEELHGIDETQLTLWKTNDGGQNWLQLPVDVTNSEDNWVEAILSSFSDFTLTGGEQPLPVELSHFYGEVVPQGILLHWITSSEIDNAGFHLYRGMDAGSFINISGLIMGAGTSSDYHEYSYLDTDVVDGKLYRYKLSDIHSEMGTENFHPEISVIAGQGMVNPENPRPEICNLFQNFPNPFNPATTISYSLANTENISLKIYDISGKLIKVLINKEVEAGYYSVTWNGDDEDGEAVNSGLYIYRMESDYYVQSKRMILVK